MGERGEGTFCDRPGQGLDVSPLSVSPEDVETNDGLSEEEGDGSEVLGENGIRLAEIAKSARWTGAHGVTGSVEVVLVILLGSPALVLHVAHVVLSLRLVQVTLDEVLLILKLEDQRKDDEELLENVLMGLARFQQSAWPFPRRLRCGEEMDARCACAFQSRRSFPNSSSRAQVGGRHATAQTAK